MKKSILTLLVCLLTSTTFAQFMSQAGSAGKLVGSRKTQPSGSFIFREIL